MNRRAGRPLAAVRLDDDAQSSVHLGSRLRQLRKQHGWSIEQAAARAGISRNTLGATETSALPNPSLSTLLALMEAYSLRSIEELFGPVPSRLVLRDWVARGRPGSRNDQPSGDGNLRL